MNPPLDETDLQILDLLQKDGSLSNAEVGRRIGLSTPATHARVRRLEEVGYIKGYAALLNHERLGLDLICFVQVTLRLHSSELVAEFRRSVRDVPEVLECHHVTGEFDYLCKVVVSNRKALERLVVEVLTPLPGVERIHTSLALSEVKDSTVLPLGLVR
jgi:DNA-binding Lrp family transcriptional regulator